MIWSLLKCWQFDDVDLVLPPSLAVIRSRATLDADWSYAWARRGKGIRWSRGGFQLPSLGDVGLRERKGRNKVAESGRLDEKLFDFTIF